jgi:hypothetical protein
MPESTARTDPAILHRQHSRILEAANVSEFRFQCSPAGAKHPACEKERGCGIFNADSVECLGCEPVHTWCNWVTGGIIASAPAVQIDEADSLT